MLKYLKNKVVEAVKFENENNAANSVHSPTNSLAWKIKLLALWILNIDNKK